MNALDITARMLVDEYHSKNSFVTKEQELGILDLSRQLNQPGFSNVESDIVSACSMIANSNSRARQPPPEDDDDDDDVIGEIRDILKEEDVDEGTNSSLMENSGTPEKSLLFISSRIISMGKSLLRALFTLTG